MNGIYALMAEMAAKGELGAVATVIRAARSAPRHEGSKLVLRADGSTVGSVGGGTVEAQAIAAARATVADGQCRRVHLDLAGGGSVCGGEVEIFVEPIGDAAPFWILGAGHVGAALAELGRHLPLRLTVVDDRADLVGRVAAETGAAGLVATPPELEAALAPTPRTLVICATRGHELDAAYVAAVFAAERRAGTEVGWLGLMGSRSKAAHLARHFGADPAGAARWQRVAVPVGVAIGAETPAELAVSILAEALAFARRAPLLAGPDGRPGALPLQRARRAGPAPGEPA